MWCEARISEAADEFQRGMSLAWHVAAFSRQKRLPNIRRILKRLRGDTRKQTDWRQQLKKIEQLNVLFGGSDNRKGRD